jgi:hypothetical protein
MAAVAGRADAPPDGVSEPIDWARPWFAPWRGVGVDVETRCRDGQTVHAALNEVLHQQVLGRRHSEVVSNTLGLASDQALDAPFPRFVPQQTLPAGRPYEQHIFEQGAVPTRDNAHDFFNGLVWLTLPRAKRRMNQLQAAEIAARGIGATRGPVRDALTVLDENGAVLMAPPVLWEALLARDWKRLFLDLRPHWREARLLVCGHALLDQLQRPRKGLTAHVWRAPAAWASMAGLDAWLAGQLQPEVLADKPFTPLPVLGVPGWWADNEAADFYDDARVFRPARFAA